MAKLDKVAARYAKAVFGYLKTEEKIRSVQAELESFASLVASQKELQLVFFSPTFSLESREALIQDLVSRMKLSDETRRILMVTADMKRLDSLKAIADRLGILILESAHTVPLEVAGVNELTADEKSKLEQRFNKILGKKIEASYSIDPTLLGGIRIKASGRTYDGSLSGWLSAFEEYLVGGIV